MKELSLKTKVYLFSIYLAGALVLAWNLYGLQIKEPWILLILCILASLALIIKVEGATNRSHYTISFLVYGFTFVLLGTPATIIVITASNLIEWIWNRPAWYIQAFNTSCYIVVIYLASLAYSAINPGGELNSVSAVLAIAITMAIFTLLNHLMVGVIVWLARGENFSKSGVFDSLPLMIDLTLLCFGASMVSVWNYNHFALGLFLLPLYLIYGTLRVPSLERQTETDSKTGLFNHGYFIQQLNNELARANRFERPLSIIMADLDLLRNINNTYGHLAGDAVLIGIASIFKQAVREYDVVARFGGEEFSVLMPETTVEDAFERAEKIRQIIENTEFTIPTSVSPIRTTISIGIAGRERTNQSGQEIIHNADTTLYHSKLKGRNQTYAYADDAYTSFLHARNATEFIKVLRNVEQQSNTDASSKKEYFEAAETHFVPSAPAKSDSLNENPIGNSEKVEPRKELRRPSWVVNLYIGVVMLAALLSWSAVSRLPLAAIKVSSAVDWLSLAIFALFVILTEWFSIDLYVRNTAISTSAVPILAGTLLFGALGSLVLSLTFAITAWIKYRSPISRFFFNFSNQVIAGMIYTSAVYLTGRFFLNWNPLIQLLLCLVAALIVYLSTTSLVAGGISLDLRQSVIKTWKDQYSWLATFYLGMGFMAYALIFGYMYNHLLGIFIVAVPLILLRLSQKQYVERTRTMVNELREKNQILQQSSDELNDQSNGLLDTLSEIIDLRDPYVLGHSRQVTKYATEIARLLGLHEKQIQLIYKASLLHDIGKLGISTEILSKPSRLTPEEYEIIKKHVIIGANLVEKSPSLRPLISIIRHHHEFYNGNGYPDNIKENEISLEARIVAVADAIAAMASDRPYRKQLKVETIINELRKFSGRQFDPLVVEVAVKMVNSISDSGALEQSNPVTSLTPTVPLKSHAAGS
jgi:diguanylate cyclase (GGDEF)-like protein/putative nucleotidyltransferase with HDIG domain